MSDGIKSIILMGLVWGCLWFGQEIGESICDNKWHKELQGRNLGEYDSETGKWKWKEIKETEK